MSNAPTDEFRAYMAPLSIAGASNFVNERWEAIESWARTAPKEVVRHLISAIYADDVPGDELQSLWSSIQEKDSTFSPSPQRSSRLTAAAVLDYLFTYRANLDIAASLGVLTASFGGRSPAEMPVDIVARAIGEIDDVAVARKSRSLLAEATANVASGSPLAVAKSLADLDDDNFTAAKVLAGVADTLKAVSTRFENITRTTRAALTAANQRLDYCDEESEVLWYVFAGVSHDARDTFEKLGPNKAAVYAPKELADRTSIPVGTNALKALLSKCGVQGEAIGIREFIESVPAAWIGQNIAREPSARLYPISRALDRFREFGGSGGWVPGWAAATGISETLEIQPLDFAVQFYRERTLVRALS